MKPLLACAALAATGLAGRPLAGQVFHATADVVHVPVVVSGRTGDLVRGLRREDFVLKEDGRPERIEFFAEGAPGDALPLHLGLLLDTSESMERDLPEAATASIQFVNAVDASVDTTLVDFDTVVRVGRFAPASYPQLFERIRHRRASGMTALYDALGIYIAEAAIRDGQHVLVLYTDGGDSNSSITFGKVLEILRLSDNIVVYAIGYLENQRSSARLEQQMLLTQLARETGGTAFFPAAAKQMSGIYDRIRDELASRYTIGYTSTNRTYDGRFRKLQVSVARPDLKGATIRTRPGYYAARRKE